MGAGARHLLRRRHTSGCCRCADKAAGSHCCPGEEDPSALPRDFSLEQNYPNPFNAETVIRFEMREKQEVELAIYNLAGQKLVQLVAGSREAGVHTVRWDGRDERGRELASGVYVYRLLAGKELMETRKMALVR